MEVELSKKCTPLWRRKAHVHVQNTPCSEHFWKLRCRKSARRCGLKHISKSKCTKHHMLGALLEVEMSKSARHCGAKHISKSKCTKHTMVGALCDVEKVHAIVARRTFSSQNVQSTPGSDHFWKLRCRKSAFRSQNVQSTPFWDHFWKLRCRKSARRCGAKHISKSKC